MEHHLLDAAVGRQHYADMCSSGIMSALSSHASFEECIVTTGPLYRGGGGIIVLLVLMLLLLLLLLMLLLLLLLLCCCDCDCNSYCCCDCECYTCCDCYICYCCCCSSFSASSTTVKSRCR